jgi:endonuclease/exonuclease/phosphatase family metal-dependent hydrolase
LVEAQDYRYISADLYALGKSIKLIVTHLAFDNNRPDVLQAAEMSELYTKFASYPYVIMMGDFNYKAYVMAPDAEAAGYKLANDDSFKTYPNGNMALDNILVKGLNFVWVKMISSNLSDHNPILARITL